MPAPISLIPPSPGDGSGICDHPDEERPRGERYGKAYHRRMAEKARKHSKEHYKERVAWAAERWWKRRKGNR